MNEFEDIVKNMAHQISDEEINKAQNKADVLKKVTINAEAKMKMIAWDQQ